MLIIKKETARKRFSSKVNVIIKLEKSTKKNGKWKYFSHIYTDPFTHDIPHFTLGNSLKFYRYIIMLLENAYKKIRGNHSYMGDIFHEHIFILASHLKHHLFFQFVCASVLSIFDVRFYYEMMMMSNTKLYP